MNNDEIRFLQEITDLKGTSGNEDTVRNYFRKKYEGLADKIETDGLGSLAAYLGDKGPKIMAVGHMDEVGFMVRSITEDGFVKFSRCGFFFVTGTFCQHFVINTDKGPVKALCSLGQGHFEKMPEINDLVMDIGCTSKQEAAELGVKVGDFIVPEEHFRQMGDGKYLVNKAWDNRIGCAIALRTMENLKKDGHDNIFVAGGSVQEEVGTRGAVTLGNLVKPAVAFSIDIGTADDMPGGAHEECALGKGPELCFMDSMTISNRRLMKLAIETAEENGIPYQTSLMKHGGTDAGEFQKVGSGVPVLLINVPCRYPHTPTSMIHYDDYENAVKLLTALVKKLDQKTVDSLTAF